MRFTRSSQKREGRHGEPKRLALRRGTSVEVRSTDGIVRVTEPTHGHVLVFNRGEWEVLPRGVSNGEFDVPM